MLIVFTITVQGQIKLVASSIDESYTGSSWEKSRGYNYVYDGNNNLITEIYLNWNNTSNKWEYSGKDSYTYNVNNKVIQILYQNWNTTTNQFENSYATIYSYNLSGNITGIVDKKWNGSQFIDEYKNDFSYNSNNLLNSYISYSWNGLQWINEYRGTVTYNSNNKVISSIEEKWESTLWVNSSRAFLTYNGNNKIMTDIGENWNGSIWEYSSTLTYNYDVNGNTISYIDSYNGGQYKTEYNYDTSKIMSDYANPFKDKTGIDYFFEEFPYVNKIVSENEYNYNNSTSSYENDYRTTYDYNNSITLSTENFEKSNVVVKVFPNPSKNFIQVSGLTETENYELYSILGTKIIKGNITDNEKIDTQNLSKGLYFLKFKNGNTIKFIKE